MIGNEKFAELHQKARRLYGKHFVHVNSTYFGGGVAELLHALVPLMNNTGVDTGWRVLAGNADFFGVTKKLHNLLQGDRSELLDAEKLLYVAQNEEFSRYTHIVHQGVVVHDPQPLPLAGFYRRRQPWIWRCHIDLSEADPDVWDYLAEFVLGYDAMVVSADEYLRPGLPIEQRVSAPAIDPLAPKNVELPAEQIASELEQKCIPTDLPLVVQVSRFDKWKDPLGLIEAFLLAREEVPCRLVLCGGMASDDPEGLAVFREVEFAARPHIESGDIILVNYGSDTFVNALQRSAAVVAQKSLREGFGLTVTEALWKARPVVATDVGGLRKQITDGETGMLCPAGDHAAFAQCIVRAVREPEWAEALGRAGRERVRERFLITRVLGDTLDLFSDLTG